MSSSGLLNFGTTVVGSSPTTLAIAGLINNTNITVSGNNFTMANGEISNIAINVFMGAPIDVNFTIDLFDATTNTVVQSYTGNIPGGVRSNFHYNFSFSSTASDNYRIRITGVGSGNPNALMTCTFGQAFVQGDPGSGGASFATITSGTNTTATMIVGSGAAIQVQGTGSIGASTQGSRNIVLGSGSAGNALTTGNDNTFVGNQAGKLVSTSKQNTIVGSQAGAALTVTSGGAQDNNTLIGFQAGTILTNGDNTFVGSLAGSNVTTGNQNTLIGSAAGGLSGSGGLSGNVFVGYQAGTNNTANNNTCVGTQAGNQNVAGVRNTYIGYQAANAAAGASDNDNTFIGHQAGLLSNGSASGGNSLYGSGSNVGAATAINCTAIGFNAVAPNGGTVIGKGAGKAGATAQGNTIIGNSAGAAITNGNNNTFVGDSCGLNVTGGTNTIIGASAAGITLTTGTGNTLLGKGTDTNASGTQNAIIIGTGSGAVKGSSSSIIQSVAAINSATTNDLYIASADTGINRVAAGVLQPNTGNGGTTQAWFQTAGLKRVTTQADKTDTNLSSTNMPSWTITNGRTYTFWICFITTCSGAGGAKFDFNGGAATASLFACSAMATTTGTAPVCTNSTALNTALISTNQAFNRVEFYGTVTASSTGTFIPQFAQNTASGTSSVLVGSFGWLWDTP